MFHAWKVETLTKEYHHLHKKSKMLFDDLLEEIGFGIFQKFAITVCGLATVAESMATTAIPFATTLASCDLNMTVHQVVWLNAVAVIGMSTGGYSLGGVSDVSGRKYILSTTSIVTFVGCFVASFAQCVAMLFVSLFLLGMGLGGNHGATRTYVIEIVPKSCRGARFALLECFSAIGYILAICISWLLIPSIDQPIPGQYIRLNSWRILFGLSGSLSIFSACLMSVFPPSPRWLLAKKLEDDAINVLRKIYSVNKVKHEESFPNIQLNELASINPRPEDFVCNSHLLRTAHAVKIYTRQMFVKERFRVTAASIFIAVCLFDGTVMLNIWLALAMSFGSIDECRLFGALPVEPVFGSSRFCPRSEDNLFLINIYFSIGSLSVVFLVFVLDKFQRRYLLSTFSTLSGICCVSLAFAPYDDLRHFFGFCAFSFYFLSEVTFRVLILESFPTILRSTAYAFIKIFPRIFLVFFMLLLWSPCFPAFITFGILFTVAGGASVFLYDFGRKPMED